MSLPMKWWISVCRAAPPIVELLPVARRTIAGSRPGSRSARRTRRTSSCPGCRESRSRNRGPAAKCPSRAAARRGNGLEVVGNLRLQRAAGLRPLVEEAVQLLDVHEQVLGRADLRLATRKACSPGRSGRWGCSACRNFAAIAVLVPAASGLGQVPLTKRSARKVPATGS